MLSAVHDERASGNNKAFALRPTETLFSFTSTRVWTAALGVGRH
jgi:hypothetical protein